MRVELINPANECEFYLVGMALVIAPVVRAVRR